MGQTITAAACPSYKNTLKPMMPTMTPAMYNNVRAKMGMCMEDSAFTGKFDF